MVARGRDSDGPQAALLVPQVADETIGLSIAVVSWNTRDLLLDCLQSVYETLDDVAFEVLVVDNASTDGSLTAVRENFPSARRIANRENLGFSRANNQAIRQSRGRLVLLLNSDARLTGDAARQLVGLMEAREDLGIVGPCLMYPDGRPQVDHGPLPSLASEIWSLAGLDKLRVRQPPEVEPVETGKVSGACLVARRQMLQEIGLLDEGYFMFSEEIDLCYRARQAGWKVMYLPSAQVIHWGGGSTGLTPERYLMLYRSKVRYFAKHYGTRQAKLLLGAMRVTAHLKVLACGLLRQTNRSRARADDFWPTVADGLQQGLV